MCVKSTDVGKILSARETNPERLVAAICAAPTALKKHAVFKGRSLTSYPNFKQDMVADDAYKYSEERVVVDGQSAFLQVWKIPNNKLTWKLTVFHIHLFCFDIHTLALIFIIGEFLYA